MSFRTYALLLRRQKARKVSTAPTMALGSVARPENRSGASTKQFLIH